MMQVASNNGLMFNSNECQMMYPQIIFYSTILSTEGMWPNQDRIQIITEKDVQLQSFMGMINFMLPYTPHL